MSEAGVPYLQARAIDHGCPPQFAEYIVDGVVRIMGVLAEVLYYEDKEDQPYWRAFEMCDEHDRYFVSYMTAQGHLTPFRHAVVTVRETIEWCYLRKGAGDGDTRMF